MFDNLVAEKVHRRHDSTLVAMSRGNRGGTDVLGAIKALTETVEALDARVTKVAAGRGGIATQAVGRTVQNYLSCDGKTEYQVVSGPKLYLSHSERPLPEKVPSAAEKYAQSGRHRRS